MSPDGVADGSAGRSRASARSRRTVWLACVLAGVAIGYIVGSSGMRSRTPGPIPPPGDTTSLVTTRYECFGFKVAEETYPWAEHDHRFNQVSNRVIPVFILVGGLVGAGVGALVSASQRAARKGG
jgi:hypothetical protein